MEDDEKTSKNNKSAKVTDYHKLALKNLTKEEENKKIREIHSKKFMNFPTNSGISGTVFKTKEVYHSNNASKETKFQEEIDN
jgi:hypothetical protein